MAKWIFGVWCMLMTLSMSGQDTLKYFVRFKDKAGNGYTVDNPQAFLSSRALDRRARQQIPVTEQDEPVTAAYVEGLRQLGFSVLYTSKWFNGVAIATNDPQRIQQVFSLPYVLTADTVAHKPVPDEIVLDTFPVRERYGKVRYDYGAAFHQIQMLQGDLLHDEGYTGKGMMIAVIDAGFPKVNTLPVFASMRQDGRLLTGKDFAAPGTGLFEDHPHGTLVLSSMAGYVPGEFIGVAPHATYLLLRSEDAATEMAIELYNWVAAAEYADSAGADILNTSLGYSTFDDSLMNYRYSDLNGDIIPITRGADIAASKGMLVVNSAGNLGNDPWRYISAPADGDSVFTIGAVDSAGQYVSFSSQGPTYDGRIKPNVAAQGRATVVAALAAGEYLEVSGTSLSSPLIAGMAACLWQAHPGIHMWTLKTAIEQAGHQAAQPDNLLGYGIPRFMQAHLSLATPGAVADSAPLRAIPNPFSDALQLTIDVNIAGRATLEVVNARGAVVYVRQVDLSTLSPYLMHIPEAAQWASGVYLAVLRQEGKVAAVLNILKVEN